MNLVEKVEQIIIAERLLAPEDSIVVAVSGGPDSIALLHILFLLSEKWKWKLVVGHVNHQFRGEESDTEAAFVADYASSLQLPHEIGVIDVSAFIRESGLNAQVAAREKRYDFLLQVAEKYDAGKLALAHHADDQAETVLMRLLRGTGTSGLAGILQRRTLKNVELIRPFLRIYKSEVLEFCNQHQLPFCMDSSNALNKYFRNQVRLDLIPLLKQYNPQFPESLNRLAEVIAQEDNYLEQEVDTLYKRLVSTDRRGLSISRERFGQLHIALQRRLIKLILSYLAKKQDHYDFTRLELVRKAMLQEQPSTTTLHISERIHVVKEYDKVYFTENQTPSEPFLFTINDRNGELAISDGSRLSYFVAEGSQEPFNEKELAKNRITFDLDALHFPLTVRNRRDGDRIQIIGLNGSKKVKDIFIDEKVSPGMRNQIPLIVDAMGRILWIPGFRRSIYGIPTDSTTFFFCMEFFQ